MSKTLQLLSLLLRNPPEFWDRTINIAGSRLARYCSSGPDRSGLVWEAAEDASALTLPWDLGSFQTENAIQEVELYARRAIGLLPSGVQLNAIHNGDFRLGRLCYAIARALRPRAVVETGVCYGVASAFILKALDVNGAGILYSIDLPPLGMHADSFTGCLVPANLKKRWKLLRGLSKKLLPKLLQDIGTVDVFLHDSLHTYNNMRWEFDVVTPHLTRPSALISDDVERNSAFQEWVSRWSPDFSAVIKEESKKALMGIGLFLGNARAPGASW